MTCHTGARWGWSYCSSSCPCDAGEGDCDYDTDCRGSLVCSQNVGAAYGRHLVPIAIIMALIGSMLGSFVGLGVAELLAWLAGDG